MEQTQSTPTKSKTLDERYAILLSMRDAVAKYEEKLIEDAQRNENWLNVNVKGKLKRVPKFTAFNISCRNQTPTMDMEIVRQTFEARNLVLPTKKQVSNVTDKDAIKAIYEKEGWVIPTKLPKWVLVEKASEDENDV